MASSTGISKAFGLLQAAGIPKPKAWDAMDPKGILKVWRSMFSNVSDEDVIRAAEAYASSGEKWWPTAGQLRALVPRREGKLLEFKPGAGLTPRHKFEAELAEWSPGGRAVWLAYFDRLGDPKTWPLREKDACCREALDAEGAA